MTAFAGYLFHGWRDDRIGRRNTIAMGWILSSLSFGGMLLAPIGSCGLIIALYSAGLFFLIGPYAALLFFNAESYPVHTRATGGAVINARGQVGAIIGSLLITLSLSVGWSWTASTAYWGRSAHPRLGFAHPRCPKRGPAHRLAGLTCRTVTTLAGSK